MKIEQSTPIFYCPYDLSIETMNAIWESKEKAIKQLKKEGYSDTDINDIMDL